MAQNQSNFSEWFNESIPEDDAILSSQSIMFNMQFDRYAAFKSQNSENAHFNVVFKFNDKKLYAHKFYLVTVSETFKVMFSERWKDNVDAQIEVKNYSYDDFYQFLCFFYSGECEITDDSIFQLTDMAEFYNVQTLLKLCDKYLWEHQDLITAENVEEMFEFAQKYNLPKFRNCFSYCVKENHERLYESDNLLVYNKSFVEFLSTIRRPNGQEEDFFIAIFNWAKEQASAKTSTEKNLQEVIKTELSEILSNINFSKMNISFVADFIVKDKAFLFTTSRLCQILLDTKRHDQEEKLFKALYELAEKEAINKRTMYAVETFKLENVIKSELSDFLPHVKFTKMTPDFIMDFIVPKEFLFSPSELYKMISSASGNADELFEALYKFAIIQIRKKRGYDINFDLFDAVKNELSEYLHFVNSSEMTTKYVLENIGKMKRIFSSSQTYDILLKCKNRDGYEEELFRTLYYIVEIKAIKAHDRTALDDIDAAIKDELVPLLPQVNFKKMNINFFLDFIIYKDFLFFGSDLYKKIRDCQRDCTQEQDYFKALYFAARNKVLKDYLQTPPSFFSIFNYSRTSL